MTHISFKRQVDNEDTNSKKKKVVVAVVTGSSSGIGFETSLLLARNGFFTYATMRNLGKSNKIIESKQKEKLLLEVLKLDVADDKSVKEAIEKIANEQETIDALVNNAGYGLLGPLEELSIEEFKEQFEANVFGEPGVDPSLIENALKEMDRQFWYLKKSGVEYYFDKEPQINKIIYDYMQEVNQREIRNKINETLDSLLPQREAVNVVIWDRERLEDNDKLKIFVLDYEEKINEENEREFLKPFVEYRPDGEIRDYQNTIVFVFADEFGIESIIDHARMVCAIKNAQKDERIRLDTENLGIIKSRLGDAEGNLTSECLKVYSKVGYPHLDDIKFDTVSIFEAKTHNIVEPVLELLARKGKLIIGNLSPDVPSFTR